MKNENYRHVPVLLKEAIQYLSPRPNQNFVDATLGGGGYTKAIWDKIQPNGRALAIDLDEAAIENFKFQILNFKTNPKSEIKNLSRAEPMEQNLVLHHGNFRDVDKIVKYYKFPALDGIVADIGLSSHQLDQSGRGFSFQSDEALDMRFDRSSFGPDAKFILNNYEEKRLAKIFSGSGEEKFSSAVAGAIVRFRQKSEIQSTTELYKIIKDALPKPVRHKAADSARRIFQALRIEVNRELENLEVFLPKAFALLKSGGRLAVVSFHSLEDRIVKQYFAGLSKGCACPPEFPVCVCGKNPQGKILTKKPVGPLIEEKKQNPRSHSGKLRVIEKI